MRDWIKYSTLGIEMAVIVGGAVWGGVAIDRKRGASFPLFTLLFAAVGLTVAIIRMVRGMK
jgi:hypothetical protein